MKKTIYLPDELGDRVRSELKGRISSICQAALRREIARREAIQEPKDTP